MKPKKVSDVELAFPAQVMHLLPKWEDIPEEFKNDNTNWNSLVSEWFFGGLSGKFIPKEGIDLKMAMRHLQACMHSYQPKHEHKEAGVAYLMSQWFEKFERKS
jgi:hypothetical protein